MSATEDFAVSIAKDVRIVRVCSFLTCSSSFSANDVLRFSTHQVCSNHALCSTSTILISTPDSCDGRFRCA